MTMTVMMRTIMVVVVSLCFGGTRRLTQFRTGDHIIIYLRKKKCTEYKSWAEKLDLFWFIPLSLFQFVSSATPSSHEVSLGILQKSSSWY